jgi:hypothetical protein
MACHGCFLKEERSNEAIFQHATPHVNFWRVPLIDNLFEVVECQNFCIRVVHDTIKMECFLIEKHTESRKILSLPIFCSISSQSLFLQSQQAGLMCCLS